MPPVWTRNTADANLVKAAVALNSLLEVKVGADSMLLKVVKVSKAEAMGMVLCVKDASRREEFHDKLIPIHLCAKLAASCSKLNTFSGLHVDAVRVLTYDNCMTVTWLTEPALKKIIAKDEKDMKFKSAEPAAASSGLGSIASLLRLPSSVEESGLAIGSQGPSSIRAPSGGDPKIGSLAVYQALPKGPTPTKPPVRAGTPTKVQDLFSPSDDTPMREAKFNSYMDKKRAQLQLAPERQAGSSFFSDRKDAYAVFSEKHQKNPGRLFESYMRDITWKVKRVGSKETTRPLPVAVEFVTSRLQPLLVQDMRLQRECETLAASLDHLAGDGNAYTNLATARCGDVLVQRLKALEYVGTGLKANLDSKGKKALWARASNFELIPKSDAGIINTDELNAVEKSYRADRKAYKSLETYDIATSDDSDDSDSSQGGGNVSRVNKGKVATKKKVRKRKKRRVADSDKK